MRSSYPIRLSIPRLTQLAACLAAALALGAPASAETESAGTSAAARVLDGAASAAIRHDGVLQLLARKTTATPNAARARDSRQPAAIHPVTSCADDGSAGTLRLVALTANTGDTIDLSALTCGTITLQTGTIHVDVDDLAFQGPPAGSPPLTIDGNNADRVFFHGGVGTLDLQDLTVSHGYYTADHGFGGCIYSNGSVVLTRTTVTSCTAVGTSLAVGGGVVAHNNLVLSSSALTGNLVSVTVGTPGSVVAEAGGGVAVYAFTMLDSTVSGNTVQAAAGKSYGGGVMGFTGFTAKYSTITDNQALASGIGVDYGIGGGLVGQDSVFIQNCTIDHNHADGGGGLFLLGSPPGVANIRNSTISSNTANLLAGGVLANTDLNLSNSTIAFNEAGPSGGGGLFAQGADSELESSIIADNTPSGTDAAADLDGSTTITGANNLIKISGLPVPPDTITLDPLLRPLAYNGGLTRTHALVPDSPAIDTGNNVLDVDYDQRGIGYPRVSGSQADIGAFEFGDRIFADGLD